MYRREVLGTVAGAVGGSVGSVADHPTAGGGGPGTDGSGGGPGTAASGTTGSAGFAPLATLPVEGAREAVVGPDGATVYLAVDDGFAVADVAEPTAPRLLAERRGLLGDASGGSDGSDGPIRQVQDVAVEGDRLLVMGPAHPGTRGPKAAILYDVADPADPRRLAVHRTDYPIHNGTLAGGRAYLAANDGETNPVEVVAMTDGPRVLGRWSLVDADDAWADVPARLRPIHDVIVHRGVACCSYWDAGTWLVDVRDPAAPRVLGHLGERTPAELAAVADPGVEDTELPGNHHSAAVDESGTLLAVGHEAWDDDGDGAGGPGGIDLVDVSEPASPRVLATVEPPPSPDPSRDGGVWTTAHNFELREGRLYSAWYQGGVRVHDVSDPASPREVAAWRDPAAARFWTAQVADGARTGNGAGTGDGRGAASGTGGGAVVASSARLDGDDSVESGLYVFPRPGATDGPEPGDGDGAPDRRVTATPGLGGFGVTATLAGGGLAWLLARRRRRR